jgi:hypothetical protein
MKKGDIVQFREPLLDEDPGETYILMEDPELYDRVDIMPVSLMGWPIPPVQRVNKEDLICVS